jgi:hypothetical protein
LKTRTARPIPLSITALIAFLSAVAALAFTNGHDAHAHGTQAHSHPAVAHGSGKITPEELAFRNDMRVLWEDHVTWTRLAVISLLGNTPDTSATVGRLLQNQTDIGNAIKPFYGDAAGNALTDELRKHILIAADLIAAAKAGNADQVAAQQARWHQNAEDIAALLNSVNPEFWNQDAVLAMLDEHLRLTTDEVVARLQGNWAADVASYDRIHHHALGMADTLSTGIIEQFPKRFR